MNNEQLQNYFHFDESDLYANRNGNLSEKQQERLLQKSRKSKTTGLIVGLIFFGAAACLLFFIAAIFPQMEALADKIIWSLFFGVFILFTAILGSVFISKVFKKTNLILEKAEGAVNIVAVQSLSGTNDFKRIIVHELNIGGQNFRVPALLADYIAQGDTCAIYFLRESPNSKIKLESANILSMELFPKA